MEISNLNKAIFTSKRSQGQTAVEISHWKLAPEELNKKLFKPLESDHFVGRRRKSMDHFFVTFVTATTIWKVISLTQGNS